MKFSHVAAGVLTAATCAAAVAQGPVFGHRTYNGGYAYNHADLNNDGREDLVYHTQTGFAVVLSTGDATYGTPKDYNVPDGTGAGTVTLDLNNDGKMDIIAYDSFASGFYEYLNNGDGTFHLQATYVMSNIDDMVVGDFNHDGYPDLAFTTLSGSLHVWFNNHASGFNVGPTTSVPGVQQLSVGDFDGDGKADIAASTTAATYLYFGDNAGHFTVVNATTAHHPEVYLMDIDGDGKSDLVGMGVAGGSATMPDAFYRDIWVVYGNASRTMTEAAIPTNGYAVAWTWGSIPDKSPSVDVADFNGDGKRDLALVEAQNSDGSGVRTLVVMTGKGGRQWNPEQNVYSNSALDFGVAVLRANQDGLPDLLVDTFANNSTTAQFFVNDTVGGFYGGCAAPNAATGIHLCSAAVSGTSVTFKASSAGQTIMRKMEIWVDGVKQYEQLASYDWSHYAFLQKALTMSAGKHTVTIYSAGYDNLLEKTAFSVTVP